MNLWEKIEITAPADTIDILSDFIISATSRGVEIVEPDRIPGRPDEMKIIAWFSREEMEKGVLEHLRQYIERLFERLSAWSCPAGHTIDIAHTCAQEENWSECWKKYFKPIHAGRSFVIKPSWELFDPAPDDLVIDIDPGQAFGVGTHASTALMLENIEWLWQQKPWCSPLPSVLDVGTGTGILGIAAAMKGASLVRAVDIDPEAVRIARENTARNRVHEIMRVDGMPVDEITESFSVVLANIDRKTIETIAGHLARLVDTAHGTLLVSGLLTEQMKGVAVIFQRVGMELIRTDTGSGMGDTGRDEWCCLVFQKHQAGSA